MPDRARGRHHFAHAARADLLRRLGRSSEAAGAYRVAIGLVRQEPERRLLERRFLERRLVEVGG
jgi:RNA polymerase sigma-70 factor (ECF subfamily)